MKLDGVSLDFCAVMTKESVTIKPIDNPNQVNPYEYGQEVLRVVAGKGKSIKSQPLFERALLISGKERSTLFISGTASILGQDITGIEDIEKQTIVTLDNIEKLTDKKRIGDITGKTDKEWGKFILLRVYVKNQNDFAKVKMICQKRFPGVPSIFIQSDICRDNLLVEAEAEFLINN
jgi:enamine deaminase RidA (YjgF/YER057c/UK114 family)